MADSDFELLVSFGVDHVFLWRLHLCNLPRFPAGHASRASWLLDFVRKSPLLAYPLKKKKKKASLPLLFLSIQFLFSPITSHLAPSVSQSRALRLGHLLASAEVTSPSSDKSRHRLRNPVLSRAFLLRWPIFLCFPVPFRRLTGLAGSHLHFFGNRLRHIVYDGSPGCVLY